MAKKKTAAKKRCPEDYSKKMTKAVISHKRRVPFADHPFFRWRERKVWGGNIKSFA